MKGGDILPLAISVGGPMVAGQLVGLACMKDVKGWYTRLKKPRWTPPNWLFGVAWPVLYLGNGVASFLVWKNKAGKRAIPLGLYGAQMLLNLIWQPIMFKLHRPDIALGDSVAVLGVAAAATVMMTIEAGKTASKVAVATMMAPYVAWLSFATALTYRVWRDNPRANGGLGSATFAEVTAGADKAVSKAQTTTSKAVSNATEAVSKAAETAQAKLPQGAK